MKLQTIQLLAVLSLLTTTFAQGGAAPAAPAAQAAAAVKPGPSGYHVLKTLELGGEGGWDYLVADPDNHRVFVSRSTHVMVVDVESGKVAGDIPDTSGVHGIALAPDLNRGFTSNGKAGTATIFDLKTLATIGTVKTGDNPDAILYDASTKRVFTFNGRSKDATAIDAAAGTVSGTIELGGKPEFAVADGHGKVFVNIEDKSEIVEFDAKELKVIARWPLAPGEEPSGLAIDPASKRLFSVCGNEKMVVLDCESGKVVATLAIGKGVDAAAFDAASGLAFSSNGDGTMTVVHMTDPAKFEVLDNVPTGRGARTMALDAKSHVIYLPAANYEPQAEAKDAKDGKRPRPKMIPGSFRLIVVGK
jgi:DNA-binding beta-propeller fold protein YncE